MTTDLKKLATAHLLAVDNARAATTFRGSEADHWSSQDDGRSDNPHLKGAATRAFRRLRTAFFAQNPGAKDQDFINFTTAHALERAAELDAIDRQFNLPVSAYSAVRGPL